MFLSPSAGTNGTVQSCAACRGGPGAVGVNASAPSAEQQSHCSQASPFLQRGSLGICYKFSAAVSPGVRDRLLHRSGAGGKLGPAVSEAGEWAPDHAEDCIVPPAGAQPAPAPRSRGLGLMQLQAPRHPPMGRLISAAQGGCCSKELCSSPLQRPSTEMGKLSETQTLIFLCL